jgi:iron-sulfur cluster assembly protein
MITITETAAKKIVSNIVKRGQGQGIKVGVKTTGCSGLAYVLEYLDEDSIKAAIADYRKKH